MKRCGEIKCMLLHERSQYEKAVYCVIPTLGQFGKGKARRQVLWLLGWGEGDWLEHRGFQAGTLPCRGCNDGYMSLHVCLNPQTAQHRVKGEC